LMQSPKQKN